MAEKFPARLTRSTKQDRGRTPLEQTPIAIRSSVPIKPTVEARMRKKLARRIGHAAPLIERGTVRFEDINGPRGGVDTVCRIKLVLSGRPSVQANERAHDVEPAFDGASFKVQNALERVRGKHGMATGRGAQKARRRRARTRTATRTGTRAAVAASARSGTAIDRRPMKLETARRPPSRKAVKTKAGRAKRRVGVQRGGSRK